MANDPRDARGLPGMIDPPPPPDPNRPDQNPIFPRVLYHEDSKPDKLIWKMVANQQELDALDKEWMPLRDLGFETAPAAEPDVPPPPVAKAPAKTASTKGAA